MLHEMIKEKTIRAPLQCQQGIRYRVISSSILLEAMNLIQVIVGVTELKAAILRLNYGAPGAIRTHDKRFRKPLLYPLSYRGMPC